MIRKQNGDTKLVGMAEETVVRDEKNHHIAKRCERRWMQRNGEDGDRGIENSQMVKATQNYPYKQFLSLLWHVSTINIFVFYIWDITCATGDPISNFVDSELQKKTPYFVLNTNSAVQGCFPNSGSRHLKMRFVSYPSLFWDTAKRLESAKGKDHLPHWDVSWDSDKAVEPEVPCSEWHREQLPAQGLAGKPELLPGEHTPDTRLQPLTAFTARMSHAIVLPSFPLNTNHNEHPKFGWSRCIYGPTCADGWFPSLHFLMHLLFSISLLKYKEIPWLGIRHCTKDLKK